jgi:hypothetical protein
MLDGSGMKSDTDTGRGRNGIMVKKIRTMMMMKGYDAI